MATSLTFFLNAFVNFILGLAVAAVLGPDEYGRFAVAFATGATLATVAFEWLRLSTTRLCGDGEHGEASDLRDTLDATYLFGAAILSIGALVVSVAGIDLGVSSSFVVAIVAVGIANGQFDFWTALARARFLNRTYATLVIVKNVLALAGMVGAGLYFHTAIAVIAAYVLSVIVALVSVRSALRKRSHRVSGLRRQHLLSFAQYGMPLVVAGVFYQLIVLVNRWVAAHKLGYAAAGHLSLSIDITTRLLLAVGAGFDVYLFQIVVRADFREGRLAAQALVAKNMLIIMSVLVPLAVGYAVTMPSFTAVFVPAAYRADFGELSLILVPGILAFCTIQYAFAGAFTLERRTGPYALAAATAFACDVILLVSMSRITDAAIAVAHSISLGAGCLVAAVLASQTQKVWPALRDIGAILAATALMAASVWPTRAITTPWLAFVLGAGIGAIVYCGAILAFNVLDCRRELASRSRMRRWPALQV